MQRAGRTAPPAVITVHIVSEACGTRDPAVASLTKAGGGSCPWAQRRGAPNSLTKIFHD